MIASQRFEDVFGRDVRTRVVKGLLDLGAHDRGDGLLLAVEGAQRGAHDLAGRVVGTRRQACVNAGLLAAEGHGDRFAGSHGKFFPCPDIAGDVTVSYYSNGGRGRPLWAGRLAASSRQFGPRRQERDSAAWQSWRQVEHAAIEPVEQCLAVAQRLQLTPA